MTERLECLGIPVRADETRSGAVCRNGSGEERVVLAARGYVLIVNPETGECRQVPFPEGLCDYPFASHSTESGLFLTGAGPLLMILDPWQGEFLAWFRPEPEEEIVGFAFAEGPDGTVYATTYPGCRLIGWNPKTGTCLRVGRLDDRSRYAMTLAAGADGWLYAGLGTEAAGLAAYRPADGARTTFRGGTPCRGSGQVHLGADGAVYGSLPAGEAEMEAASKPKRWFRLAEGKAVPVSEAEVSPSAYGGTGYNKLHRPWIGRRRILDWQLADSRLVIEGEGEDRTVPLVFEGNGTALSPLALGPDGCLYGTSNHPMHLFRYRPEEGLLESFGGRVLEKGGGGNICAYAAQGSVLLGAAYAGGKLYKLDTRLPVGPEPGRGPGESPRLFYENDAIHRPRAALAHPDGRHVLYGGFPGYGAVGGSLGIVQVEEERVELLPHTDLVPHQSTVALAALSNGDVIGGTSIETPGGGVPAARQGAVYRLDWRSRKTAAVWYPVPGAREVSQLVTDSRDLVHGLTSDSVYFVMEADTGQVRQQTDLSAWGGVVRQGLVAAELSGRPVILGLLSGGIFAAEPETGMVKLLASLPAPATCGMAVHNGYVYYGSGSELWRYRLEQGGTER